MTERGPIPVLPGGRHGMQYAPTRRLLELHRRSRTSPTDPNAPPALRDYGRGVLVEIGDELRRRNGKGVAA